MTARHPRLLALVTAIRPWRWRIAGVAAGAVAGGKAFLFGGFAGFVLGAMLDALVSRPPEGGQGSEGRPGSDERHGTGAEPECTDAEIEAMYARLGLDPGAADATVRRAFRQLYRQAHPDIPGGSAEEFIALRSASERLLRLNKEKRLAGSDKAHPRDA